MTPVTYSSPLIISTRSKNQCRGIYRSYGTRLLVVLGLPPYSISLGLVVAPETRDMIKKQLPIRPVPAAQDTGKKTTSHGIIVPEGQNNPLSDSARFSNKLSYTLSHKKDNSLLLL